MQKVPREEGPLQSNSIPAIEAAKTTVAETVGQFLLAEAQHPGVGWCCNIDALAWWACGRRGCDVILVVVPSRLLWLT
jgi:hypothetical protein